MTNTWEKRQLGEVLENINSKKYLSDVYDSGKYPVIQQGEKSILGYSDKSPFEGFEKVVLFGDHTLSLYKPDKPFLVATDGIKILSANEFSSDILMAILERYMPSSQGYKRHFTVLKNITASYSQDRKERKKLGNFFSQLDRAIALQEKKLENMKTTKKTLLKLMFV